MGEVVVLVVVVVVVVVERRKNEEVLMEDVVLIALQVLPDVHLKVVMHLLKVVHWAGKEGKIRLRRLLLIIQHLQVEWQAR